VIEIAHGILRARLQVEEIDCVYMRKPGDYDELLLGVKYDRLTTVFKTADYEAHADPTEQFLRPAIESLMDMIIYKEPSYSKPLRMRKIRGEREWLEKDGVVLNVYRDKERVMLEVLIG
jgi:hypothetical protein